MAATRSYSVRDIMSWKFVKQDLPKEWLDHLGEVPERFTMYVDGDPGNGKTEYNMKLAKMLAQCMGKVRYNNVEQGKHVQIQQSAERNKFNEIAGGKFQYDNIRDFDAFVNRLKRPNSGRVIIIDSISYWPLTLEQIQYLINTFKHKSFVFVAYQADYSRNKAIIHHCDVKVRVENFIAKPSGRFAGNLPFVIWDKKKHNGQTALAL
jgi:nucleoside-triphosphatase THEP1